MFRLSVTVHNLCPSPNNRHWSIVWSMTICWMLDQADVAWTHQYLAENFKIPAPVALPRFCNFGDELWNVRKSQVWRYNWSPASRNKAARWLCWPLYFLPRCMECRRGLAMRILSVCPSVRPSIRLSANACIVTKRKKDMFTFLYHTKEHLS